MALNGEYDLDRWIPLPRLSSLTFCSGSSATMNGSKSSFQDPLRFFLPAAESETLRHKHRPVTSSSDPETEPFTPKPRSNGRNTRGSATGSKASLDVRQLKQNWLESLSCPWTDIDKKLASEDSDSLKLDSGWVIGVDPDLSGALAVLKPDNSPQVYDSPHLKVMVGKRVRKRLDVKSIIQLLQSVDAPIGTPAYIEQSTPFPQDGKQGWWSGGFGYGLWIGILVALGYSVIPVPSSLWKNEFKLTGFGSSKGESIELATTLFPSVSPMLKRKKDHGRAEALLIAAFGKGLKAKHDNSSRILEDLNPEKHVELQPAIL